MTVEEQTKGAAAFIETQRNRGSLSGPGSNLDSTTELRAWLPGMLKRLGIRSIVDCPCGDWAWMSAVDLGAVRYLGLDICRELIDANADEYPQHRFAVLNAITDTPPQADLIICRDFLVHLTFDHAAKVLANFRASGARFLACTTFDGINNEELRQAFAGWGWRPLNMEAAPFNLGAPVDGVNELYFSDYPNRWTKVYEL